jgi:hypothetical protein
VPSFESVKSPMDAGDMPLMASAAASQAKADAELASTLGRTSQQEDLKLPVAQPVTRLYRLQPGADQAQIAAGFRSCLSSNHGLPEWGSHS